VCRNDTLEAWTCTTGACQWDKRELKKVQDDVLKPIPLQQFCHHIKRKKIPLSEIRDFRNSHIYADLAPCTFISLSFFRHIEPNGNSFPTALFQIYLKIVVMRNSWQEEEQKKMLRYERGMMPPVM